MPATTTPTERSTGSVSSQPADAPPSFGDLVTHASGGTYTPPRPDAHQAPASPGTPLVEADSVFPRTRRPAAVRISPYGPSTEAPTSDFEARFRDRLDSLGVDRQAPVVAPKRSTVTATVTALRSAIEVDRLLSVAKGLTPQAVSDAYRHVEALRSASSSALDRLIDDPTVERFEDDYDLLVAFMPRMVWSLARLADEQPESFGDSVVNLAEQVDVLEQTVDAIESRVRVDDPNWPNLLAELDDGRNRGVYHHVCYRPRRVGDIVPVRLAYLMGDAQEGPTR